MILIQESFPAVTSGNMNDGLADI